MLHLERVYDLFRLFSDLDDPGAQDWLWLCEGAADSVCRRLREGVDPSGAMDRLCAAAAAIAYDRYILLQSGKASGSDEIKVGEITLKNTGGGASGTDTGLAEHFLAEIADLIRTEGGFVFTRTPSAKEESE